MAVPWPLEMRSLPKEQYTDSFNGLTVVAVKAIREYTRSLRTIVNGSIALLTVKFVYHITAEHPPINIQSI